MHPLDWHPRHKGVSKSVLLMFPSHKVISFSLQDQATFTASLL